MIIDGVFKSNTEQIEEYQAELRKCLYADANGDPVITMYYEPDEDGNYSKPPPGPIFLWGQAVFIIAQLLTSGLLHINELDTIRRYLPSYNRPRKGGRYSAFQVRITSASLLNYSALRKCPQKKNIEISCRTIFLRIHAAGKTRNCKFSSTFLSNMGGPSSQPHFIPSRSKLCF